MGARVSIPMYRRSLAQRIRLTGHRCRGCGTVSFPPVARCHCCHSTEHDELRLSGKGVIEALTAIDRLGAPPEFAEQTERSGGYDVAIARLAEGPAVTAQVMRGPGRARIGDPVRVVIRRLYEEEGVVRYGFKLALDVRGTAGAGGPA